MRPILLSLLAAACLAQQPVTVTSHTAPLAFTRFTDPKERAFTTDVPTGWRTTGGLFRHSPIETRTAVRSVSPDGQVTVTLGDENIPPFMVPNQMLQFTGFNEGARYPNNFGGFYIVRRYVYGMQFAEEYVRTVAGGCSDIAVVDRRPRPDLTRKLNELMAQMPGVTLRIDAGEVAFTCTRNGQPMRGYVLAGTLISQVPNGVGMWYVNNLHTYIAPAAKAGVAQAALRRMVATHQNTPEWAAMQSNITRTSSKIMAQSNAEVSRMISDTYWNRQRVTGEAARKDANARRGTVDLVDPDTGESWNVSGGRNYYWRKPGSNTIVGTDTADSPGTGWVRVQEY